MKIFMNIAELFVCHMRVYLRGGDVGVTEEGLDGAEIGAVWKQVGGEGVANGVRCHFLGNASFYRVMFDYSFYWSWRQS